MIERLLNVTRQVAAAAARGEIASAKIGLVTSYDPQNYCVKCSLQPLIPESGWMPYLSAWVGNGWGLFSPPPNGTQVMVLFLEGSLESPIAIGSLFSSVDKPLNVPAGELWMVHQSGQYLKLTNDGKIALHGTVEIDIGNVTGTLHKLVTDAMVTLFNAHVHSGVQSGGSNTGAPTTTMGNSQLTAILKAN